MNNLLSSVSILGTEWEYDKDVNFMTSYIVFIIKSTLYTRHSVL
jgi:hypothetical protein